MSHQIEIRHPGLNKYRLIKGRDRHVVEQKAQAQLATWAEQWARRCETERKRADRAARAEARDAKKALAAERTVDAQAAIDAIRDTLQHTLSVHDAIDWNVIKDRTPFPNPEPLPPPAPVHPPEPRPDGAQYNPPLTTLDRILFWRGGRKRDDGTVRYMRDREAWETRRQEVTREHQAALARHDAAARQWATERQEFVLQLAARNAAVDSLKEDYLAGLPSALVEYCDLVLSRSEYPDTFPKDWQIDYDEDTRKMVVDYTLPSTEQLPKLKEVRYVQSRDELDEILLSDSDRQKLYDDLVYQITLRTIHELFEADARLAIDAIVFNGWATSLDPATGKDAHACIVSVQASRQEFLALDLSRVDPRACFKRLNGVGSSQLHTMTPVAPIMQMATDDRRFVSSHDLTSTPDAGFNLAAMEWEDFERLIRDVFDKEFSSPAAEAKVTRASRDGGVVFLAFDPDPIRGGKMVIQAKRHTSTVAASAVRDLHKTVLNEGATRGILFTTADYAPDAYEFAQDKPLTLFSGTDLLDLLAKHGQKARIDLDEAKRILAQRPRVEPS